MSSTTARPLLQPPAEEDESGAIWLNTACGLDLEAPGVPTIAVIGPSRRGKSVLAGLLAGGDPGLFPQSHSSFQAMTSGTHIVEVPGIGPGGAALRLIDTEGLSHVGRSRVRREALVRQFLVSTYLTSSWVIWLDSEVLSTNFFTMMWLVHDYVVDVLKVKDAAGDRLPRLMYIRTQETEVQQQEYREQGFASFFDKALAGHEDADILRQMFAPGGLHGHALPIWTVEDLEAFGSGGFWAAGHDTPFKAAVGSLRDRLLPTSEAVADVAGASSEASAGPPLLALAALEQHLPRIARLEAFDPRDHEAAKVSRLRQHLRAAYGRGIGGKGVPGAAGAVRAATTIGLLNIFDPEDREVRRHGLRIDEVVQARLEEQCRLMRLELEVASADPEVVATLERFRGIAPAFSAAAGAFADEAGPLSEREILRTAVQAWRLDPAETKAALATTLKQAEGRFLEASGLTEPEMRRLNMHEKIRWRIEDVVMRLRGKVAAQMLLLDEAADDDQAPTPALVWRIGEWRWKDAPQDGKTRPGRGAGKPREYAVWTDGASVVLYEERPRAGVFVGWPLERFAGVAALPLPEAKGGSAAGAGAAKAAEAEQPAAAEQTAVHFV